jgi:hypothetical protein
MKMDSARAERKAKRKAKRETERQKKKDKERVGKMSLDILAYACILIATVFGLLFGAYWSSHKVSAIVFFGLAILFSDIALCAYWISKERAQLENPLKSSTDLPTPSPVPTPNDRPDLFIVDVRIMSPIAVGKTLMFGLVVRNAGKATAHELRIPVSWVIHPENFEGRTFMVSDSSAVLKSTPIRSGAEYSLVADFAMTPLDADNVARVKSGGVLLFLGKGQYENEQGQKWPFEFCFQYDKRFAPKLPNCTGKVVLQ